VTHNMRPGRCAGPCLAPFASVPQTAAAEAEGLIGLKMAAWEKGERAEFTRGRVVVEEAYAAHSAGNVKDGSFKRGLRVWSISFGHCEICEPDLAGLFRAAGACPHEVFPVG